MRPANDDPGHDAVEPPFWIECAPETLHMAEEAECAHMALDELGVPRADAGGPLSLVGRIRAAIAQEGQER